MSMPSTRERAGQQASGKVKLTLDDGRVLSLTAGQHIEEAEEW